MRVCRVSTQEGPRFGVIEGEAVALLSGHPFGEFEPDGRAIRLSDARLLAPVLPSKVVAVGRNYVDHAAEMGADVPPVPLLFLKPSTAIVGPGEPIVLPWQSEQVEHEAELAVVIGRLCRDVPPERVDEIVLGYTCGNDVTARDLQRADGQWARAKSFDTFCPIGPWIVPGLDVDDLEVTCRVNGAVRQQGSTALMVHDIHAIVSYVSEAMTLLPGDVILTGTPAGVGPLTAGDIVEVSISGIGTLSNPVVDGG